MELDTKLVNLHSWNLSYSQAIELQKKLACEVQFIPVKKTAKLIAGLDCAFSKDGKKIIAAVIVLRITNVTKRTLNNARFSASKPSDFELIETATAVRKVTFPYIPGLLSFREAPACITAVKKLKNKPDIFIIDGQGIAHPRRLGLAAHLGLFFDRPTIGCAKSRLTGSFEVPPPEKGKCSLLKDKGQTIGAVVRTRTNVKPVFVSVGNKCRLEDAIKWTLACAVKYRLPEPTGLAHKVVSEQKSRV